MNRDINTPITLEVAAEIVGLPIHTMRRKVRCKVIKSVKQGKRRFTTEKWLQEGILNAEPPKVEEPPKAIGGSRYALTAERKKKLKNYQFFKKNPS